MARLSRLCLSGIPQHIIQRGNNRQIFFVSEEDSAAYWLEESSRKHKGVDTWLDFYDEPCPSSGDTENE